MARQSRTEEIDGVTFTVQQMPAKRALLMLHKITKAIAPALGKSLEGASLGDFKLADLELKNLGDAAQLLFQNFSESDLEQLNSQLLETATVVHEGKELPLMRVFDEVMAGKIGTVLKLLKLALEVNYGDFTGALLATVGAQSAAPPSKA